MKILNMYVKNCFSDFSLIQNIFFFQRYKILRDFILFFLLSKRYFLQFYIKQSKKELAVLSLFLAFLVVFL